ncbi:DUF3040 domain-containing protein [Propionicicella superfundia]|uniref:DUF3040 domain-containing protein n=1 Tax=Propionicicella superfundia TaxID=348582 RepID=UPI00041BFB5C|nr:DUF3040 domain-containing protein [Propionicicella superfundia]
MALSQEEQRLLDQMEAALAAEDPRLANTLRGTSRRTLHRRQATIAGVGFVVGIAALVVGMQVHPVVSVVGFLVMLAATILAVSAWRHVSDEPAQPTSARPDESGKQFMDRLEERWRRRMREDGTDR